ncbi:hypothetical protein [Saprospira grandis]|uniref:Homoserine kinase n=1 Tax=Saprospira grandis (strain Lewin) TaxID=984262 RepID=H6L2C1_SAPGL|nr:hypothetical protein [Saprospira grandis]AFC24759.1 homoserine kinase [Saprospira grandis str. Lewin]
MSKAQLGVKIKAPASLSQLSWGPGCMAVALEGLADEVIIRPSQEAGLQLLEVTGDQKQLSRNLGETAMGKAALAFWALLPDYGVETETLGFELEVRKKIPFGLGLGNEAALVAACLYGLNKQLKSPLMPKELMPPALASGCAAEDLVASLYGGWNLIVQESPCQWRRMALPKGLYFLVFAPKVKAHQALREEIALQTGKASLQALSALSWAFNYSDFRLLEEALWPQAWAEEGSFLREVQEIVHAEGGLSCHYSGQGPTIAALFNNTLKAEEAQTAILAHYKAKKQRVKSWILSIDQEGAIIE